MARLRFKSIRLRTLFVLFFIILFLSNQILVSAQPADFDVCWDNISGKGDPTQKLSTNDTSDPNQCFIWTRTGRLVPQDRPLLSLDGCRTLCGQGFQYWPPKETGKRIFYFLVPLVLLAIRFAFAAVGATNIPFVLIHLIGDPIDSIWSTLSRQELARRNYNLALELAPVAAVDVATILTAYDQWWQDARDHFRTKLQRESHAIEDVDRAGNSSSSTEPASRNGFRRFLNRLQWRRHPSSSKEFEMDSRHPNVMLPRTLTPYEIYHIKAASHFLATNRKAPKLLFTWTVIVTFLISLTGAYIRTATEKINNQTSHTLAVIMLFSFLLFAVYISSHVGNFARATVAIEAIEQLNERTDDLFPEVRLEAVPSLPDVDNAGRYAPAAPWAGINNSFRPSKILPPNDTSDRSRWTLLTIATLVVLISFSAAFALSYLTPAKGLGCRSFTWCVITAGWLISALLDPLFFFATGSAKGRLQVLWYVTLGKDSIQAVGSIGAVVIAQIGVMNNCWCRASAFNPPPKCIDIGPVTEALKDQGWFEWILIPLCGLGLIIVLIFISGYEGDNGRLLFSRTDAELQADKKALTNMHKIGLHQRPPTSQIPPLNHDDEQPDQGADDGRQIRPGRSNGDPQPAGHHGPLGSPPTLPPGRTAIGRVNAKAGTNQSKQNHEEVYRTSSSRMQAESSDQLLRHPPGEHESLISRRSYATSRDTSMDGRVYRDI
ncbi:MAG: hypothetical protein M1812_005227 [Candelaria pacifica]|nr:MAG: hypothetical protein M1812_005227 [Candelaria pacifica]